MTTTRPHTTPTKLRQSKRRDGGITFDDNFREFLRDTELSARKIIKESDRKRHERVKKTKFLERRALKDIDSNKSTVMMTTTMGMESFDDNKNTVMREMTKTFLPEASKTLPMPENVLRTTQTSSNKKTSRQNNQKHSNIPKSTVVLQEVPERTREMGGDQTVIAGFGASLARSVNAATMRRTAGGIATENMLATTMMRSSNAFSAENNYSDEGEGINNLKGPNAISRGLGSIRPEGIRTNVSNMTIGYRDSETGEGFARTRSSILDMGHFTSGGKGKGLKNNRVLNDRGAITSSSRAGFSEGGGGGDRPHTVAGVSPARGAPRSAATKIAMKNLNAALDRNSGGGTTTKGRKKSSKTKIHNTLSNHIFNRSATKGFINPAANKKQNYRLMPDKEAWQDVEPPMGEGGNANPELEVTGPINWCSDDIRVKWRGEREREEAWKVGRAARIATEELEKGTSGMVVPIVEPARHPIHALYWKYLKKENKEASKR